MYCVLKLHVSELIYFNNVAKLLKSTNVCITSGYMVSMDLIDSRLMYTKLDTNVYDAMYINDLCFNTRELSAFVKSLTVETGWQIGPYLDDGTSIVSKTGAVLNLKRDPTARRRLFNITSSYKDDGALWVDQDVTEALEPLFGMKKDMGVFRFNFAVRYTMTIVVGSLPLSKGDKILLTIYDVAPMRKTTYFVSRFRILKKKNAEVDVYMAYLHV